MRIARILPVLLLAASPELRAESILYRSDAFTVTDAEVRQGPFVATAVSRDRIVTNYPRAAHQVMFKFSINGLESEFPPGTDHMIVIRPEDGAIVTPVYVFGETDPIRTPSPDEARSSEEGVAAVTFRVDMRAMLESFRETGSYAPPNAPPLTEEEFEALYVIGNTPPLTWEMDTLRPGSPLQLHDPDGDGIFTVTLPFEATYNRPLDEAGNAVWNRSREVSHFPGYRSDQILVDALHRLALEELTQLTTPEGTVLAGARWPDIWTRDTAWGAILAFAVIAPEEAKRSLAARVDGEGRILQDTGTGGSWPVSTDRVSWSVAAWEVFAATGDREWLRFAYDAIRRSAEADLATAFDEDAGLFRGESTFLDWRDQSYPAWMDPKDIYLSQTLGTNALHHESYRVLARMARELGEPSERWDAIAARVREGMNAHLWQADRGWYAQFRYGRNHDVLSARAEPMGESFAILFDVASDAQKRTLARRSPVVPFGVPSFWPYIPGIPPYHNAGIWPQVVGFWGWASAEAGNAAGVEHALASIYRANALFLTNKENMAAETGHFEGTELNSDRFMGSIAATLSTIYRVLLGMRFHPDRLVFEPFVPKGYAGERRLEGYRYRDAVLDVVVRGWGDAVAEVRIDGRPAPRAEIPATLEGEHTIEIVMNRSIAPSAVNRVGNAFTPAAPMPRRDGSAIVWDPVEGAVAWRVLVNGETAAVLRERRFTIRRESPELAEIQVAAIDAHGRESFFSEPVRIAADRIVEPAGALEREIGGSTGRGYLRLTPSSNTEVRFPVVVDRPGIYAVDVRYANGSGPVNSSDRAALRSLFAGGVRAGAIVMPQRGNNLWSDWGYSNPLHVRLEEGENLLTLVYTAADRNMDVEVNDALVDHLRLTLVAEDEPVITGSAPAGRAARSGVPTRSRPRPSPSPRRSFLRR